MDFINNNIYLQLIRNAISMLFADSSVKNNAVYAIDDYLSRDVSLTARKQIAEHTSTASVSRILIYSLAIIAVLYIILKIAVAIKSVYNYSKNKDLNFSNLINGQGKGNAAKVRMGFRKGNYNGCGWISVYNYLSVLNITVHPSLIVKFLENRGVIAGGMFGVTPNSVSAFIKRLGIKVTSEYLPDKSHIDSKVKKAKVAVLFYAHPKGAHFITVKWDPSKNKFIIYNSSNNEMSSIERTSLQEHLKSRRIITLHYTK